MLETHFCCRASPPYWPSFPRAACACEHGPAAPFHCKWLVLAASKMSKLGRQTSTKHRRCSGTLEGKEMAAGELKIVISLWYFAWRIWNVQDYAGMDCSSITTAVKYCSTDKQPGHPQAASPTLNNKACSAPAEGPSWVLQLESWHHLGSILSPSTHLPWESFKEPHHEPHTSTAQGHTPQTGAKPQPPKLHQQINMQRPATRLGKKPITQANNHS